MISLKEFERMIESIQEYNLDLLIENSERKKDIFLINAIDNSSAISILFADSEKDIEMIFSAQYILNFRKKYLLFRMKEDNKKLFEFRIFFKSANFANIFRALKISKILERDYFENRI